MLMHCSDKAAQWCVLKCYMHAACGHAGHELSRARGHQSCASGYVECVDERTYRIKTQRLCDGKGLTVNGAGGCVRRHIVHRHQDAGDGLNDHKANNNPTSTIGRKLKALLFSLAHDVAPVICTSRSPLSNAQV